MRAILDDELNYRERQLVVMRKLEANFRLCFPFARNEVLSGSIMPSGDEQTVSITLHFTSMDGLRTVRAKLPPTKWKAFSGGWHSSGDTPPAGWKRWRGEFLVDDLRVVYDLDTSDLGTCRLVECGTSIVKNYKVVCDDATTSD